MVMELINTIFKLQFKLIGSTSARSTSIFKDPNVAKHPSLLQDKYIIVSTDKTPNNIKISEKAEIRHG
jgi:hypothetical protein